MRMGRRALTLLAVTMLGSVSPAIGAHFINVDAVRGHSSGCPLERARAAALNRAGQAPKGVTTITLTDRIHINGALLDPARASGMLIP
jgi:hypothetical protein